MIPTIKSRISCVEYAQRAGLPIRKSGDRCISPLRSGADNKSAFVVYDSFFYDFVTHMGGDVIDLCAMLKHDGDKRRAIYDLAKQTGVTTPAMRDWVTATQNLNGQIQRWHNNLTPAVRDYLHARRISDDTITALKIGFTGGGEQDGYASGRVSIPYWKNGYIYGYVARALNSDQTPKYLKRRNDDLSDSGAPWGLQTLGDTTKPLIIAEGAFDALSFAQEKFPVLATMGGYFSTEQLKTVISAVKPYPSVILTFDNDNAGSGFTVRMARELFSHNIRFTVATIPRPSKDVSDYYTAGGDLSTLISSAQDGLEFLADAITDPDEFKKFAYRAARYTDSPELARMFHVVAQRDNFNPVWLAEVRKNCSRPPSEDFIARQVTAHRKLLYRENIGFYEYTAGCWRFRDDTQIKSYIGDELGTYRTGSKLNSILGIVKTDCLTDAEFDKAPVFNFINGTLELSSHPPVFREHRPEDYCSIQASYPYDPNARSPEWEKFILDVCADDEMRATLLQEIAGYVLFPDCSLEKIFVLQGSGGNGKSVYLSILSDVYGRENVSSVTASGICDNFQRIYLSTSLMNVASEIKSNLSGSEEYLKQIASGDLISACYKSKNFVQFTSRSKLIFATNGQLKSNDTSDGLLRRLCIVNFSQSFVDYPTKPNERKRDTELLPKLRDNLPAIFNWCYEGFHILQVVREFVEMEDEADAKEEFIRASNPLIMFLEDMDYHGQHSRDAIYNDYKAWCIQAGHNQASRRSVISGIRQLMRDTLEEGWLRTDGKPVRVFIFPDTEVSQQSATEVTEPTQMTLVNTDTTWEELN